MISATEALDRLRAGNRRFVAGTSELDPAAAAGRRSELAAGQSPFAVVLGCADSRVPVELVFDQGPGDLFVVRVAGNVAAPTEVGSVEFAAAKLGTRLVVVLGHTRCGAIQATLDETRCPGSTPSAGLRALVDRVRPAIEDLLEGDLANDPAKLEREAIRANVRATVRELRHGSEILADLAAHDGLVVLGAVYSLETGEVEFLQRLPG